MIKSIKEKINKVTISKNAETLAAVKRIFLFSVEFVYSTYIEYCLLENKKTNNKVEIKDNSIKFNKDRTMPIYNKGMVLSLSAFVAASKNNKYLITHKEVRAGP